MPTTSNYGLTYPSLSSAPNVPQDLQTLAGNIDSKFAGVFRCTSSTRPPNVDGAFIYESDTKRYMTYSSLIGDWTCLDSNEQLYKRRSTTQTVSASTTLVVDNTLQISVQANAQYHVHCLLAVDTSQTADVKVLFRTPSGGGFQGFGLIYVTTASSQTETQVAPYGGNSSVAWGGLGAGGTSYGKVEGVLNTTSSGTFQVEWAQNTSSGSTTMQAGSYLLLKRVL
jgi:hypothetical protein